MLRVVLDTNVLVSAVLVKAGLPAQALDAWRSRKFLLVTSPALIAETRVTLNYPRIRRKYNLTDEDVTQRQNCWSGKPSSCRALPKSPVPSRLIPRMSLCWRVPWTARPT